MIAKKAADLPSPGETRQPETASAAVGSSRTLGIDFGEKRIGLALSDAEGRWAMPLKTIERQTDRRAIYQIADLVQQEGVKRLVLGEPRGLDGKVGDNTLRVRKFGQRLARVTGLPLVLVDEALTTVEAAQRLRDAGLDHLDRQERRDAVAAQILLQEALDQANQEDKANQEAGP